jgi:hypothetical protein
MAKEKPISDPGSESIDQTELQIIQQPEIQTTYRGLDSLNPEDLIPPELEETDVITIKGDVKIFTHRRNASEIKFVITDEEPVSTQSIERNFTYFDEPNDLSYFPETKIDENTYQRPLVHGELYHKTDDLLFWGMLETNPALRNKAGIGVAFQKRLFETAKNLGYRFVGGNQNNSTLASFQLNRGAYLIEEIKDEYQHLFESIEENDGLAFTSVQFLNTEEIPKYVKPTRIGTTTKDKLEYKEKPQVLFKIFRIIAQSIDEEDFETAIEIMEDLNALLPEADQYKNPPTKEPEELTNFLEHLKAKENALIENASLEEIKENEV